MPRLPVRLPVRLLATLSACALSAGLGLALRPDGAAAAPDRSAGPRTVEGPLVFGHRGASGYRPEHTLAAYQHAIDLGADVIEPDLVPTKDGVLVARHESFIDETTDVEDRPEFADRRRTKTIDGTTYTGFFTEDLTLAELRTLRAEERIPGLRQESSTLDGRYQVPTLDEVLALARRASKETGRTIAVAPETKHPTYFDSLGLSLEEPLLASLRRAGLDKERAPVYVQSFEEQNLRDLRALGFRGTIVQLTSASGAPADHVAEPGDQLHETYAQMTTPSGLREIATYADVIGPDKGQIIPRVSGVTRGTSPGDTTPEYTSLVADAHAAGLQVVPYTVRAENAFLPLELRSSGDPAAFGDVLTELGYLYGAGVDGVFADQPDLAVMARDGA